MTARRIKTALKKILIPKMTVHEDLTLQSGVAVIGFLTMAHYLR